MGTHTHTHTHNICEINEKTNAQCPTTVVKTGPDQLPNFHGELANEGFPRDISGDSH